MAETKPNTTKKATSSKKTTSTKTQGVKSKTTNSNTKKSTRSTTKTNKKSTPETIKITKITSLDRPTNIVKNEKETNAFLTVIGIIVLVIVAILIFRLTYGYFTATIKNNNPSNTDVEIKTADLLVRYADGDSNMEIGSKIEPGDVITKEFGVINEGSDTGQYTIVLQNIKHNLGHKTSEEDETLISDVKYTLSKVDEDGGKTIMGTGTLPFEETEYIIYTKDEVEYTKTNNYLLEVEYINHPNIDQSDSMGESLELKINIINYEGEQRTQDTEY